MSEVQNDHPEAARAREDMARSRDLGPEELPEAVELAVEDLREIKTQLA